MTALPLKPVVVTVPSEFHATFMKVKLKPAVKLALSTPYAESVLWMLLRKSTWYFLYYVSNP